jgi:hypothetical protein
VFDLGKVDLNDHGSYSPSTCQGNPIFSAKDCLLSSMVCLLELRRPSGHPVAILRLSTSHQLSWTNKKDPGHPIKLFTITSVCCKMGLQVQWDRSSFFVSLEADPMQMHRMWDARALL